MSDSPTSCKEYVWKIGPYVDGELPLVERDGLESHLETCGDCREMATSFHCLDELAGGAKPPAVSGREWATVLENVTREDKIVELTPRRKAWEWLVPASALAALLVIGVFLGRHLLDNGEPTATPGGPASPHEASVTDPDRSDVPIHTPDTEKGPKDTDDDAERLDGGF
jgi:anti-sigma factor RsiW